MVVSCCTHEIPCGLLRADEVVCLFRLDDPGRCRPRKSARYAVVWSGFSKWPQFLHHCTAAGWLHDPIRGPFQSSPFLPTLGELREPPFLWVILPDTDDTIWYSMIIWINVDYTMIFYDLWYPMILGSILAKFYSHQPSYNRSTNHVRLQVTPFWLGGTEVDDAWCGVENLKYQWRNIYLPDKSEYLQAKWVFWHTVFWTHTIPYPIWPTLPLITDPGFQSRVESVALEGDAWRVTSRALTTTEAVQSESFDAVCVANGHWDVVISDQPRFH